MPINQKYKSMSFNERYYRDKFDVKKSELNNLLDNNPHDLVAKRQVQFIDRLMIEGDKSDGMGKDIDWPAVWQNWEKQNFLPYDLYKW